MLLVSVSVASTAESLIGQVVGITDGDTLTLLVERQEHKVRIAGIDAPEKRQAWGEKSKTNLSRLTFNLEAVAECPKVDRWGRRICKVLVGGNDVGLAQVRDGMAWWYRKYAKEQSADDQSGYKNAELMAKMRSLGCGRTQTPCHLGISEGVTNRNRPSADVRLAVEAAI
ncbi:thermonuclease family protein [Thiobacillus sp.]|uniref:thermonuclease family protein n=1 Tax=Thiobacillus sp. TaxID=924 RepID=UPI0025CC5862|nr:thermonuclease family protein [Thiobacillus sp.]